MTLLKQINGGKVTIDKRTFNHLITKMNNLQSIEVAECAMLIRQCNEMKTEDITEQTISDNLYTKGQPDPDLLIRTSGEIRLSNFLPWELVYSEFVFVDKNWPDFSEKDLDEAIEEYQRRNRKFGAK